MAGILDNVRDAIAGALPGYKSATDALGNANSAADAAQLKSYQDKYGPNVGARIYQDDKAKAAAASSATPPGQGHMGDFANKTYPVGRK